MKSQQTFQHLNLAFLRLLWSGFLSLAAAVVIGGAQIHQNALGCRVGNGRSYSTRRGQQFHLHQRNTVKATVFAIKVLIRVLWFEERRWCCPSLPGHCVNSPLDGPWLAVPGCTVRVAPLSSVNYGLGFRQEYSTKKNEYWHEFEKDNVGYVAHFDFFSFAFQLLIVLSQIGIAPFVFVVSSSSLLICIVNLFLGDAVTDVVPTSRFVQFADITL